VRVQVIQLAAGARHTRGPGPRTALRRAAGDLYHLPGHAQEVLPLGEKVSGGGGLYTVGHACYCLGRHKWLYCDTLTTVCHRDLLWSLNAPLQLVPVLRSLSYCYSCVQVYLADSQHTRAGPPADWEQHLQGGQKAGNPTGHRKKAQAAGHPEGRGAASQQSGRFAFTFVMDSFGYHLVGTV
jgi:hypothetical protein